MKAHSVGGTRRGTTLAVGAGLLWLVAAAGEPAPGGVIITPPGGGSHRLSANDQVGQTFVAEDPHVTVGLYIHEAAGGSGARDLTIRMFQGMGVSGTVLDNRVVDVPQGFTAGYFDQDYSHLTLAVGQPYSVTLTSSSGAFASENRLPQSPDYPNGFPIVNGMVHSDLPDKAFRVVPVPEPAGALALVAALAAGALTRAGGKRF